MQKRNIKRMGKLIECPRGGKRLALAGSSDELESENTQWFCECELREKNKMRTCIVELASEVEAL